MSPEFIIKVADHLLSIGWTGFLAITGGFAVFHAPLLAAAGLAWWTVCWASSYYLHHLGELETE